MNQKLLKSGKVKAALGVAIAGVLVFAMAGSYAYFQASSVANNKYTLTKSDTVSAELQEPQWDPEAAKDLKPGVELAKNPLVKNTSTSDTDLYVFIAVDVPVDTVKCEGDAAAKSQELFALYNDTTAGVNTSAFTLVGSKDITNNSNVVTAKRYVYKYNTALAQNNSTASLFTKVKYANVVDNTTATNGYEGSIDVYQYVIQADAFASVDAAWAVVNAQNSVL